MGKRKGSKQKRDLGKGLWLVHDGDYISVKKTLLKPENITPQPAIRHGRELEGGRIELLETAHRPVFREDLVDHIEKIMDESGATAAKIFKEDPIAETKRKSIIRASLAIAGDWPLQTYKRGKVNRKLEWVEDPELFQVVSVSETGKEILEPFPYLEMTHQFPISRANIWPRMYWDLWLPDKLYEIHGADDAARFKLWKLMNELDNWPFYKKDKAGNIVKDGTGEPIVEGREEAMAVLEGYNATSGTTKQYHALLTTKRIVSEDEERFVLVMMLSRSVKKYANAMPVPKPGEVPITIQSEQKPLVVESVAEMLKAVVA